MKNTTTNQKLLEFLGKSPTAYQAVENMCAILREKGYTQLWESREWKLEPGKGYFVTRNGSALLAFFIPESGCQGFQIMASHSDSPMLKLKHEPELENGTYIKLNVEKYGGAICSTWFDRPLSIAGRIVVREGRKLRFVPVNIDRDLVILPNLAIHMNREVNDGVKLSVQKDLLPLYAQKTESGEYQSVNALVADAAGVKEDEILDADLFLYNRMKGTVCGANGEFIASARIDDLQCAFASLEGFLAAEVTKRVAVHLVYDNEEVGSETRQGAASTFLKDVAARIMENFQMGEGQRQQILADSFMISADNAHSVHPNYTEKADLVNRPQMNGGIVIKYSANQKYTTDAVSGAICRMLCEEAKVPYQIFHNHSDVAGGSTLGNISVAQLPICAVDIGLAQLAMHSAYETAGAKDTDYLIALARTFFSGGIEMDQDTCGL